MKKQNIIITIILVITAVGIPLIVAGSGLLSAEKANPNEESRIYENKDVNKVDGIELPDKNTVLDDEYDEYASLTETQIEQLKDLRKSFVLGSFPRKEMIIKGEIDENSPRLDLETVKNIIQNNDSFENIIDEFWRIQTYPDFIFDGSGHTVIVYLLDDKGEEQITIHLEQHMIYRKKNNGSDPTKSEMELLFGN